jgi:hypothetical protein
VLKWIMQPLTWVIDYSPLISAEAQKTYAYPYEYLRQNLISFGADQGQVCVDIQGGSKTESTRWSICVYNGL